MSENSSETAEIGLRERAQQLALAQGMDDEIAAALTLEYGIPLSVAEDTVADLAIEIVVARQAGAMALRERLYLAALGAVPVSRVQMAALDTLGRSYLALGDGDMKELRSAYLKAQKQLARRARIRVIGE